MSVPLPQPPPSLPRRGWLAMVLSPLPGVIPPTAPLALLWEPALQSQYVDIVVYTCILPISLSNTYNSIQEEQSVLRPSPVCKSFVYWSPCLTREGKAKVG